MHQDWWYRKMATPKWSMAMAARTSFQINSFRMAKDMAIELKNEDVCVTSFYPGLVMTERTERMAESGEWERDVGLPLRAQSIRELFVETTEL